MAKDKVRRGAETLGDKKGILLETGTNEFEIVEFSIGGVNYGINVAKVREVIQRTPVTAMPQAHPYIDGLFTLRGKAIPLVNLPRCLNVTNGDEAKNIIVTEINNYDIGFWKMFRAFTAFRGKTWSLRQKSEIKAALSV